MEAKGQSYRTGVRVLDLIQVEWVKDTEVVEDINMGEVV